MVIIPSSNLNSWTFPSANRTQTVEFPITATVTFVEVIPDTVAEFVPGAPPVFPKFPRDLLYPLYIDS